MGVYLKGGSEMAAREGSIAQAGVDHARVVVEGSVPRPETQRFLDRSDCLGVPAVPGKGPGKTIGGVNARVRRVVVLSERQCSARVELVVRVEEGDLEIGVDAIRAIE